MDQPDNPSAAVDAAFPLQIREIGGARFSWREAGAGEALVLLHGIGSGSGSWPYQANAFASDWRVIAWDAPGYGSSSPLPGARPNASDYARALEKFLTGLSVSPKLLVGHSFGALVAGRYAMDHPELPGLLLADPANGYGAEEAVIQEEKTAPRRAAMKELGPEGLAANRSSALLSNNASEEHRALVRWNMGQLNPDGYVQATYVLGNAHLIGDLPAYNGPVLVMCGSEDTVTPEAGCRLVAKACPRAEYRTIPGAGHASYIENSGFFNGELARFLESLDG